MISLTSANWPPANGGRPSALVVLCHGANASGDVMGRLVTAAAALLPSVQFVAPHGPRPSVVRPQMREWFSPPYVAPVIGPRVVAAAAILDAFIDQQLAELNLPPHAYALGGFSQGALISLQAGLRRAVPPLCIVAAAGVLVNPLPIEMPKPPPVQLISGLIDPLVLPKLVRDTEAMLRAAGVAVEAHYVPGLGHEITPPVIAHGATFLHAALSHSL
jgi:phospholipase/carboxylesterase